MKKLNTTEKLSKWMDDNVKYAYVTKDHKISENYEKMYLYYKLQSPQEFYKSKTGVCWDQAIFEKYIFESIMHKKCKLYYIVQRSNVSETTHTFCIYEDNGKKFYFENSFEMIRGIYPVKTLNDTFDFIIANMRKQNKDSGVEVFEINKNLKKFTNNYTKNTDPVSFMDFCESCKLVYTK